MPSPAHIEREKKIHQVEQLLLKGFESAKTIARITGLDHKTVKRYMEVIRYRWAELGTPEEQKRTIGEYVLKSKMVEREAWLIFQDAEGDGTKLSALKLVLEAQRVQMRLKGITEEVINNVVVNQYNLFNQMESEKTNERFQKYIDVYSQEIEVTP